MWPRPPTCPQHGDLAPLPTQPQTESCKQASSPHATLILQAGRGPLKGVSSHSKHRILPASGGWVEAQLEVGAETLYPYIPLGTTQCNSCLWHNLDAPPPSQGHEHRTLWQCGVAPSLQPRLACHPELKVSRSRSQMARLFLPGSPLGHCPLATQPWCCEEARPAWQREAGDHAGRAQALPGYTSVCQVGIFPGKSSTQPCMPRWPLLPTPDLRSSTDLHVQRMGCKPWQHP